VILVFLNKYIDGYRLDIAFAKKHDKTGFPAKYLNYRIFIPDFR
jgi:hypothetical protein